MDAAEFGPSLLAAFARVPDVYSRHGRRSPWSAVRTRATAAMRCGARGLYALAQWGRLQLDAVRHALGFRGAQMPGVTTLHYVFKRLDVAAPRNAVLGLLPQWRRRPIAAVPRLDAWRPVPSVLRLLGIRLS